VVLHLSSYAAICHHLNALNVCIILSVKLCTAFYAFHVPSVLVRHLGLVFVLLRPDVVCALGGWRVIKRQFKWTRRDLIFKKKKAKNPPPPPEEETPFNKFSSDPSGSSQLSNGLILCSPAVITSYLCVCDVCVGQCVCLCVCVCVCVCVPAHTGRDKMWPMLMKWMLQVRCLVSTSVCKWVCVFVCTRAMWTS